ncbi:hydantoinase B/oxoprolinase family protein [Streptomyces iranensis]|uniref:hydantoinase B/oxoprolinase family protein n=1 Tax=Streptomyces iranensis TaxID=576784 RepID=UPI0039B73D9E
MAQPTDFDFDPIELEILRSRLQAVANDAADAVYRTAISPITTEGKDFSATLLSADGALIVGGGFISLHWLAATRSVRAILTKYGDSVADGDIFLVNDPYQGGGLHPSDVFICRPIYAQGELCTWICMSAHMIDMGGAVFGSFAPNATSCYEEAFRIPPVRLFAAGEECKDVWGLVLTNVRMPDVVEMDMRSLTAAAHVAYEKSVTLIESVGLDSWRNGVQALRQLSEAELVSKIKSLPEGVYVSKSWVEWRGELLPVPCTLTISAGELHFDFDGSHPQVPFFINSQPYIILSAFLSYFCPQFMPDLPYNEGVVPPITVTCPESSITHAAAPAPLGCGHMHVAFSAGTMMMHCVQLAAWSAKEPQLGAEVNAPGAYGAIGLSTWAAPTPDGGFDGWAFMEGALVGASAGWGHDGVDCSPYHVPTVGLDGSGIPALISDVEILEDLHPIQVVSRSLRRGTGGAGRWRSGRGIEFHVRPRGVPSATGQMLGMHGHIPMSGIAGGSIGDLTELLHTGRDGTVHRLGMDQADVSIAEGEEFTLRCASGGGVGDPLDRDPADVVRDVNDFVYEAGEALATYGVVVTQAGEVNHEATAGERDRRRAQRLAHATGGPADIEKMDPAELTVEATVPLYPGVVGYEGKAVVLESGTVLTSAPGMWFEGCTILEGTLAGSGPEVTVRSYLDPATGRALFTEAVPRGSGCSISSLPGHWAGTTAS